VTTQAVLADTYVINPTMILDVRAGFTRWYYTRIPGNAWNQRHRPWPSFILQPDRNTEWSNRFDDRPTAQHQLADHQPGIDRLSAGVDNTYTSPRRLRGSRASTPSSSAASFHKYSLGYFQNNGAGGVFGFDNLFTAATNTGGASGSGYASFLLGLSNNSSLIRLHG